MSKAMGLQVRKRWDLEILQGIMRGISLCAIGFVIGRGNIAGVNPMIVAYYASIYSNKKIRPWIFLATILGITSAQSVPNILKYALMLISISIISPFFGNRSEKKGYIPYVAAGCSIVVCYGLSIYNGLIISNLGGVLLESAIVFFLTVLFQKGTKTILVGTKEQFGKEAFLSLAVISCAAAIGLLGIQVLDVSLLQVVSLNLLLYVGYQYGLEASAVMGIAIGLALKYGGSSNGFIIWSILGVTSGLFRELGKIGCAIAYLVVYLLLLTTYGTTGISLQEIEVLAVTIGVFVALPIQKVGKNVSVSHIKQKDFEKNIYHRLNQFAKIYANLSGMLTKEQSIKERLDNEEINGLIDQVAARVCSDCSLCNLCWQKDFYNTYKAVYSVLSAVENKGEVKEEDIPNEFISHCMKVEQFVVTLNRVYEMYKTNLKWENRMIEQRGLFADQFLCISKSITELSKSIVEARQEDLESINRLTEEFKKYAIKIKNVHIENDGVRREIIIDSEEEGETQGKEIVKMINKMEGSKYQLKEIISEAKTGIRHYHLCEKEHYKFVKGHAKSNKEGQTISGDSFSFLDLDSGVDLIALSDGMGSGEKAFLESKATVEMLEQLLEGGFDMQVAIKMVNALLGVRNDYQTFATLDVSMLNRFTGEGRFIKNGAVATYLKRGDKVEKIQADTLPLGIFKDVDLLTIKRRLKSDDLIIMMSDGISDASSTDQYDDTWVEEIISGLDSLNPQKMADTLLEAARDNCEGQAIDDMTVLVVRVWERQTNAS